MFIVQLNEGGLAIRNDSVMMAIRKTDYNYALELSDLRTGDTDICNMTAFQAMIYLQSLMLLVSDPNVFFAVEKMFDRIQTEQGQNAYTILTQNRFNWMEDEQD